ncbi:hypothetical protein KIN20_001894 [Parelaphostrongylus tenuis]|uniref:HORMA domain-containing protein n=1 Tax=Parelaphostrongylus tenuis TaxID=148309 RepID=A0AAD5QEY9_PARTN|nr:hypothetical protein KIN20_001894 [Parelaphostrongylus tenuis]
MEAKRDVGVHSLAHARTEKENMAPFTSKSNTTAVGKPTVDRNIWASTFPSDIRSVSESTVFFTRCAYVAFSHILASRRLLPKNAFKQRNIDGNVRAYIMDTATVLGARMAQKFRGVTEAIEQQYLRELILVVSSTIENVTDVIEMYTWRMRYEFDGEPQAELLQADGTVMVALTFRGIQYLGKQTAELLNTLRTLCRELLKPLPLGASPFIRITYTDRTPKGYQAPGFYRFPDDPILRPDAQQVPLGLLQTKYHGVSVGVQSICIDNACTVKCCLKRKVTPNGDSLDESLDGEAGAGDDAQHPSNNDTIVRISGTSVQQTDCELVVHDVCFDVIKTADK